MLSSYKSRHGSRRREDQGVAVVLRVELEIERRAGRGLTEARVGGPIEEGRARCCFDILEGIPEVVIMIVPGSIASLEACEHGFKLAETAAFSLCRVPCSLIVTCCKG